MLLLHCLVEFVHHAISAAKSASHESEKVCISWMPGFALMSAASALVTMLFCSIASQLEHLAGETSHICILYILLSTHARTPCAGTSPTMTSMAPYQVNTLPLMSCKSSISYLCACLHACCNLLCAAASPDAFLCQLPAIILLAVCTVLCRRALLIRLLQ